MMHLSSAPRYIIPTALCLGGNIREKKKWLIKCDVLTAARRYIFRIPHSNFLLGTKAKSG